MITLDIISSGLSEKQYLIFQYLNIFVLPVNSKEDARGVPLRDMLLFFCVQPHLARQSGSRLA